MKNITLIFSLIILFIEIDSYAQGCDMTKNWIIEKQAPLESGIQKDIFFIDNFIGFTVGVNGSIRKTVDGGNNWTILEKTEESGTRAYLNAVYFINKDIGFAGGEGEKYYIQNIFTDAVLLKTTDGGKTWNKSFVEGIREIYDIKFYDTLNGIGMFATKEGQWLTKTTDGGKTWKKIDTNLYRFKNFNFIHAGKNVLVYGEDINSNSMLITFDHIGVLNEQNLPPPKDIYNYYFFNENIGYAGSEFKTVDGGKTWTNINFPTFNTFSSHFYFYDEYHGIIANQLYRQDTSGGEISLWIDGMKFFETNDGGNTWDSLEAGIECAMGGISHSPINGIIFFHSYLNEGKIKFNKSTTTNEEIIPLFNIYPNPTSGKILIQGPEFSDENILLITNMFGQVILRRVINSKNIEVIDITDQPKGIYTFEVIDLKNKIRNTFVSKILKR